ncbi:transmembrane protein 50A [Capsaspora owczarzaki ATCC 30864]|uniref:Transmembrane protein 50A n=1 Tax=Capsaspora owczarzaki (strain ATCC 30864) TaxID=595528 RepID=A0A0D2VRH6_CAPO3|nr:transmembrane protein 50A [Capsaspora owczarzaki ATCC 30864]KJE93472.1 transmembrane protein 50A [Capsaspora owczarzaki ATCC 30864]|eukprot:XP_004348084.1 transmembrane protein 50A [Capsaspora owczarzaki ATCC 30864]
MSGFLDNIRCSCNIDVSEYRNSIASYSSGVLFAVGWWLFIDAQSIYSFDGALWVPSVASTVALFMINAISTGHITGETYNEGCIGTTGARIWLFLGFGFAFGGLIASCWIMAANYIIDDNGDTWVGVALFLQNFLIFLSSMMFKFGRTDDTF